MKKTLIMIMIAVLITSGCTLYEDMEALHNGILRLHVVGASNSDEDQTVKLAVKDAVNIYLGEKLESAASIEEARDIVQSEIPSLKNLAEEVLREQGFSETVQVSLEKEAFPRREYDTFLLPSGVYQSLRIRIGEAEGKNWWCVVFPSLCLSATGEDMKDLAVGAGFSEDLTNSLIEVPGYEIRFFFLDLFGQLQNFWYEP